MCHENRHVDFEYGSGWIICGRVMPFGLGKIQFLYWSPLIICITNEHFELKFASTHMITSSYFWKIKWVQWKFHEARSNNATGHAWIFEKRLLERDPLHFISQWKQKGVYVSPWMLHAFLAIDSTLLHVLFSILIVWSLMYEREITSRLREMF